MSNNRRVALLIGNGSRVPAILECVKGLGNVDVVFTLSCIGEGIAPDRAKSYGVEFGVIRWNDFKSEPNGREKFSKRVVAMLNERNIDFIIMDGWRILMPASFIAEFGGKVVNIHHSILPAYSGDGERAIHAQWEDRADPAGCTLHYIDEGTDTGKIILHGYVDVGDYKTEEEFAQALH